LAIKKIKTIATSGKDMAKKWSEVIQSEAFQSLSSDEQEAARNQYFDEVVKPQVPEDEVSIVRQQFDADTIKNDIPIPEPTQEQPEPEGLRGRLTERLSDIGEMTKRNLSGSTFQDIMNIPKIGALAAGETAGAALDVIGTGIVKSISAVMPESVKDYSKEKIVQFLNTDIGKKGIQALQKGEEYWNEFEKKNPDGAMALEGIFNLTAFGVAKESAKITEREAANIIADVTKLVSKDADAIIDKQMLSATRKGINKGIRPGVEGKKTFSQAEQFYNKAKEGVETIVSNKNELRFIDDAGQEIIGKLPANLSEFSSAIDQTKRTVFRQYDELAKQTLENINLEPVINKIQSYISNKALQDNAPEVVKYAEKMINTYLNRGSYTASEAQEAIKILNEGLGAYFKNPSFETATKARINGEIAQALRKQLDDTIERATGEEYQALKNQYAALKAIERDVNRRMIVDLRKNAKNLLDFTDVFSGSQIAYAVARQDPALIAAGTVARSIARWHKKLNDPNRAIKNMFEEMDSLYSQKGEFKPKSMIFQKTKQMKEKMEGKMKDESPLGSKANPEDILNKTKQTKKEQKIEFLGYE